MARPQPRRAGVAHLLGMGVVFVAGLLGAFLIN
jgi:hypothetical protein